MDEPLIISADSHLFEPPDLWETRLPQNLRDRAPGFREVQGRSCMYFEGCIPFAFDPTDELFSEQMMREGETEEEARERAVDQAFGSVDPDARIAALDLDGVWGEVIFPGIGNGLFSIADAELSNACIRVYNDFIFEVLGANDRFAPIALIRPDPVDAAVAEIERAVSMGLRGIALPVDPGPLPYSLPIYDPIWAAAQAAGIPITLHVATSSNTFFPDCGHTALDVPYAFEPREDLPPGQHAVFLLKIGLRVQEAFGWLVAGGVLERFPDLHFVLAEAGSGWLAWAMDRVNEGRWAYPNAQYPQLAEKLQYYARRQIHATFSEDQASLNNIDITGAEALLWGSDYPHPEGSYPHSRESIEKCFAGVDPDDKALIIGGTAAKLWRFNVSSSR